MEVQTISCTRVDKGPETGNHGNDACIFEETPKLRTDPAHTVVFGPSTSNQVRIHISVHVRYVPHGHARSSK